MSDGPKLTFLGRLIILLFIAGCFYGAYRLFLQKPLLPQGGGSQSASASSGAAPSNAGSPSDGGPVVEIGIAYGTEKERWMTWAAGEFAKSEAGKNIKVNLLPMGSLEGAQAILGGDQRINVWSPASSLYQETFADEWNLKYNKSPIVREESLALTPMVFVMWAERYDAFMAKYNELSFRTIGEALREPGGWDAIAHKPEWGVFKFGHTHPNQSNSGLMTLVLMAYDFHKKNHGLALKDILNPDFQTWTGGTESAVTGLSNSTGNMMRDMVLRGPSSFDALVVYENVAIDYLKNAEGRWGELRIAYPKQNMWNDNPYIIVDAPWSTGPQRKAAGAFLDFLLTEPIQTEALKHGFRPANPNVPIKFAESPFIVYQKFGLSIDIGSVGETPKAEVISNLLASWQRSQGNR